MRESILFKQLILAALVVLASGCAHDYGFFPVSSESGLTTVLQQSDLSKVSLYVKTPEARLSDDVFNFNVVDDAPNNPQLIDLLNLFALEKQFERILLEALHSQSKTQNTILENQTDLIQDYEDTLDQVLLSQKRTEKNVLARILIAKAYLDKKGLSKHQLTPGVPRVVLAYGLSDDLTRLGISAKVIILNKVNNNKVVECSDEFFLTALVPLEAAFSERGSDLDAVARSSHAVREGFFENGKYMMSLITDHLNGVLTAQWLQSPLKIKSDFVSFDNEYYFKKPRYAGAEHSANRSIRMFSRSQVADNYPCQRRNHFLVTDEQAQAASQGQLSHYQKVLQQKENTANLARFMQQQTARNTEIMINRALNNN